MTRTTQIRLAPETAKTLREIAAAFDFYQTRGVLASYEVGNPSAMLEALVRSYQERPVETLAALGQILAKPVG